ncbi:MAG: hypothetical protein WCP39_06805, partial [Chlamydiota bacterium]
MTVITTPPSLFQIKPFRFHPIIPVFEKHLQFLEERLSTLVPIDIFENVSLDNLKSVKDAFWQLHQKIPIFVTYYEEVLVVRVHPEYLGAQRLPNAENNIWKKRYQDIAQFEKYLDHNGILVRKFFLHVSKKEQKKRFLERLDKPDKNWKFSQADVKERQHWDEYMEAYE